MPFIQIIEFTTSHVEEVQALYDQWMAATEGTRTAKRLTLTNDRDTANTFIEIVEFPSYEEAMQNSDLPATQEISSKLFALCDTPSTFRNLDVVRVDER